MVTPSSANLNYTNQGAYQPGYCKVQSVNEITRDPYNEAVAEVLREIYINQGSPLGQVSAVVGVSRMSIRRYLTGERDIKVVELRRFAEALSVSVTSVLVEADRRLEQCSCR